MLVRAGEPTLSDSRNPLIEAVSDPKPADRNLIVEKLSEAPIEKERSAFGHQKSTLTKLMSGRVGASGDPDHALLVPNVRKVTFSNINWLSD